VGEAPSFNERELLLALVYKRRARLEEIEQAFEEAARRGILLGSWEQLLDDLKLLTAAGIIVEDGDGSYTINVERLHPDTRRVVEKKQRIILKLLAADASPKLAGNL